MWKNVYSLGFCSDWCFKKQQNKNTYIYILSKCFSGKREGGPYTQYLIEGEGR
jgi:hypothetical protein